MEFWVFFFTACATSSAVKNGVHFLFLEKYLSSILTEYMLSQLLIKLLFSNVMPLPAFK